MEFVKPKLQKTSITTLTLTLILSLVTIVPLCFPLQRYPLYLLKVGFSKSSYVPTSASISANNPDLSDPKLSNHSVIQDESEKKKKKKEEEKEKDCDLSTGEWIPNREAPYYTNTTCTWGIHEHQNCMKYGRPDSEFLKWRWKPDGCELPIFNPHKFFEIVKGKSIAFVGDSVARNQMQSLICLLSKVEYPIDVSNAPNKQSKLFRYTSYNFTLAIFWSPYLVKTTEANLQEGTFNIYLDEFNEEWTTQVEEFDYLIISAGHWFFRPSFYYENRQLSGCLYCKPQNLTHFPMSYGYKKAFNTAFRAINSLKNYKGVTFFRTFAPSHFENGEWNQGGNCVRTRPFNNNETNLQGGNLEAYKAQLEEFEIAKTDGEKRGLRYRLIDITKATLLRPDGHPSRYGKWQRENPSSSSDCVHWCLPGPIDSWNDFLLEIMLRLD